MRIAAGEAQETFSGNTIKLDDQGDNGTAEMVIAESRKRHAVEYKEPEKVAKAKEKPAWVKVSKVRSKAQNRDRLKGYKRK